MNAQNSINVLQFFITALNAQSFGHKLQSRIFADQGFNTLAQKYADHAAGEAGFVDQFIGRLLDLGGTLSQEATPAGQLFEDVVEFLKFDNQVSVNGIEYLRGEMQKVKEDDTTYDILKEYLKDEEEDMYWSDQQLALIEKIGLQNWLVKQL